MRVMRLLGLGSLILLGACTVPDLEELLGDRSVKVEASFNFKAGCIQVLVRDQAAPDKSERVDLEVLDRSPSERQVEVEVRRRSDWGLNLEVLTTAHEQYCTGPVVASNTQTVTLDTAGVQTVKVALSAVDTDGDGFVPTAGGGTDCDDNNAAATQRSYYQDADGDGYGAGAPVTGCVAPSQFVARDGDCDDTTTEKAPGRTEVCDGLDNDCANGIDDGLASNDFYLDADRDDVGAGPVVKACVAPPNHVVSGNDCDDADAERKPGLVETCDEKDNDCDNLVDDGLAVSTFYRDVDNDGFGVASDPQQKCRAPNGYVANSTDCDDTKAAVSPSAVEVCNDIDDNCRNGTDEGFNKVWYLDADGDTYGAQFGVQGGCMKPEGYVAVTSLFDCDDANHTVNPGAAELCDGFDNNCVNGPDEPFTTGPTRKGASCGSPCSGVYVCNASRDGTVCNAPTPTNYYTDADGDGDGATSASAQAVCPSQPIPANAATRNTDCDDTDKYNKGTGTEVCDQRDNNCDTTADEGNVCAGAGWKALTDPAVVARDWNTVAINKDSATGYPVWIAGANGALARRTSASGAFTSFDGACGAGTWNAAWVSKDGSVYLTGNGGRVARHDGSTCVEQFAMTGGANGTGIIGFDGSPVSLYVVDDSGRLHSWTPGSAPSAVDDNAPVYLDVHGFDSSRIFIAAQEAGGNQKPLIETYTGGSNTTNMFISGSNNTSMRSVWMASATLAYAVGDGANIQRWGGASWAAVTPPAVAEYTSVCAPDRSSVYVTDATGVIRRFTGTAWVTPLYTASGALKDIALVSPTSIWAVGPAGRVVHFPELP